jgi:hypothetical protein
MSGTSCLAVESPGEKPGVEVLRQVDAAPGCSCLFIESAFRAVHIIDGACLKHGVIQPEHHAE